MPRSDAPRASPPSPKRLRLCWNRSGRDGAIRNTPREWLSSLSRFAYPRIGKIPVSEVTSADLLDILTPLWHRKVATAKRVRQRLRAVLEWAVAMEYRIDNPCNRIGPVLGPQQDVTEHMQAVPHREAAAVIRKVRGSTALAGLPSWPLSFWC